MTQTEEMHSSMNVEMSQTDELAKLRLRGRLMGMEDTHALELFVASQKGRQGVVNVRQPTKNRRRTMSSNRKEPGRIGSVG